MVRERGLEPPTAPFTSLLIVALPVSILHAAIQRASPIYKAFHASTRNHEQKNACQICVSHPTCVTLCLSLKPPGICVSLCQCHHARHVYDRFSRREYQGPSNAPSTRANVPTTTA